MYEKYINLLEENIKEKEVVKEKRYEVIGKHFSQMTKEERMYLLLLKEKTVKRRIIFTEHALQRMGERNIFKNDVINTIKVGQIIDYALSNKDEILTIRGCHTNKSNKQVYVVYSLTHRVVITTYSKKQWLTFNKDKYMKNYKENFCIEIPESFKKKVRFYYL